MTQLVNSMVRGFGFTLGRKAADVVTSSKKTQPVNSTPTNVKDLECWSHKGYEEDDVKFVEEVVWTRYGVKWYGWLITFIPIIGLFPALTRFYKTFIKKSKIYFYDFKWETFTISDGRTTTGVREIKKLLPQLSRVSINPPQTRNKVESIFILLISLFMTIINWMNL